MKRIIVFVLLLAACSAQPISKQQLPGVYDLPLPARCKFTIFTEESHVQEWAVGLACPGVDFMRLYPWPPVQPWDESPSWELQEEDAPTPTPMPIMPPATTL